MIELTEHQRHELGDPEPLAIDPVTRETYVLVRRKIYERLKSQSSGESDDRYPHALGGRVELSPDVRFRPRCPGSENLNTSYLYAFFL